MILGIKNVQCLPERGLSSGEIPKRVSDMWCECGSKTLDGELCSPPTPTPGLSHRPPVGTTYIPALPGETRADTE